MGNVSLLLKSLQSYVRNPWIFPKQENENSVDIFFYKGSLACSASYKIYLPTYVRLIFIVNIVNGSFLKTKIFVPTNLYRIQHTSNNFVWVLGNIYSNVSNNYSQKR